MEFSILDHCVGTDPTCLARSHTLPTTILFSGFGFFFRKEERIFTKLNQTRVRKIFYKSAVYLDVFLLLQGCWRASKSSGSNKNRDSQSKGNILLLCNAARISGARSLRPRSSSVPEVPTSHLVNLKSD